MSSKYKVLDNCGGTLRMFLTWSETDKFRQVVNRPPDWTIIEVK